MRSRRLHRRSDLSFVELARRINPIVADWINYDRRFYPAALIPLLQRVNAYLVRWIRKKYRRLAAPHRALRKMWEIAQPYPPPHVRALEVDHRSVLGLGSGWQEPCKGRSLRTVPREPGVIFPPATRLLPGTRNWVTTWPAPLTAASRVGGRGVVVARAAGALAIHREGLGVRRIGPQQVGEAAGADPADDLADGGRARRQAHPKIETVRAPSRPGGLRGAAPTGRSLRTCGPATAAEQAISTLARE
ncbi:group II intron maturase-specific domain-containing protein [Streptomyces sp. NBC_00385]|uniref:group II intron maturase-specific domain-containing protein n=1 Tax=Streptomyces sp. NBC_00385 TaxID=2975733 RepID=UPI003FA3C616